MRVLRKHLIALFVPITVAYFAFLFLTANADRADSDKLDVLIVRGRLVDGSGKKPRQADVGIRGDRIAFVGDARKSNPSATRTIDATGLIVAPGFIDPHTHTLSDLSDEKRKGNEPYLLQGGTTYMTGNDGESGLDIGETVTKWDAKGNATNAL